MRIFISYAFEQEPLAGDLQSVLEQAGHKVFHASSDLRGAENYTAIIRREIHRTKLFIFLISPESTSKGTYALTELEIASRSRCDILPVMAFAVGLEELPSTLRTRTILSPRGNLVAETADRVQALNHQYQRRRIKQASLSILVVLFTAMLWWLWPALTGSQSPRPQADVDVTLFGELGQYMKTGKARGKPSSSELAATQDSTADVSVLHRGNLRVWGYGRPPRQASTPQRELFEYAYERSGDKIHISPHMPYVKFLKSGGPINRLDDSYPGIPWYLPQLSIKVLNTSDRTLLLSEVEIAVRSAVVDETPLLTVDRSEPDCSCCCERGLTLAFRNHAWGMVIDPVVEFGLASIDACMDGRLDEIRSHRVNLESFEGGRTVSVANYVPQHLRLGSSVCAFGMITYSTTAGIVDSLRFLTELRTSDGECCPQSPGIPVSAVYDVFLAPEHASGTLYLAISQAIQPDATDHFLLRLGAEQSTSFDLTITIRDAARRPVSSNDIEVYMFVPRGISLSPASVNSDSISVRILPP